MLVVCNLFTCVCVYDRLTPFFPKEQLVRFDVKIKMIGFRRVGVTYVYRAVQPRLYYVVTSVLGMKGSLVAGWLVL